MRWGITDEEKAEGKVLPFCLEEIGRSRPFFLGLLGERYGWIPDDIAPELIERYPWLANCRGRSVTEMEIVHAVLQDPLQQTRAFLYFRDPGYGADQPLASRAELGSESPDYSLRLEALKQRLRRAAGDGLCLLRENYTGPEELGRLVLEDFARVIDQLFPTQQTANAFEGERDEHDAFARNRTDVYVGREAYFDRLDAVAAARFSRMRMRSSSSS